MARHNSGLVRYDLLVMNNPNWAEILSAKSGLWAAIFAGAAAAATGFAAGFAWRALTWAKAAALAAQSQITILERQIALSEPQPIVVVSIRQSSPTLDVENVGDDLAFDVQVGPIGYPANKAGVPPTTMKFDGLSLLKRGGPQSPEYVIEPNIPEIRNSSGQFFPASAKFFEGLRDQQVAYWDKITPGTKAAIVLANLQLTYKNSRGRLFTKMFDITLKDKRLFGCSPTISLVDDQVRQTACDAAQRVAP
jgi:hypothetical protein